MRSDPLIFLSAGEASGDHYGAELIAALKQVLPRARFTGLGGTEMEAAGQHRVIRAEDVAVMGITEILRHIPCIYGSYRTIVRSIRANPPHVAVLIDFPDVNFRLAKHLKRLNVPVLWFVSPQLWAWKRRRLRWVQQRVTKMLTIFPFEQLFYANRGVEAEFVGHPLAEQPLQTLLDSPRRPEYATQQGLEVFKNWVALLPGSRSGEIDANLPEMLRAAALLGPKYEYLVPVAPTVSKLQRIRMQTACDAAGVKLVDGARAALRGSRAAVIASGTATVQAAIFTTPMVVVYRVSRLTFFFAKRLVNYPEEILAEKDEYGNLPIAMVNLIAGKRVVPELLQDQFTAENIVKHLKPLLETPPEALEHDRELQKKFAALIGWTSEALPPLPIGFGGCSPDSWKRHCSPERLKQLEDLAEVTRKLQSPCGQPSILRVRDAVLMALNLPTGPVSSPNAPASNE